MALLQHTRSTLRVTMQQSSRVSRWMTCGVSQTTKLRAHLLASGWQDDMQSFSNSKTQKRPQTRRFSQSRALCEPCSVLPEECTCACPQILVAVPVFPLCTANLQCEKGRSGFSPLVSPQTLLDETPGPIDDLGPGFCFNCASIRKLMRGHLDKGWLLPNPFARSFHTLLLVNDSIMQHSRHFHAVGAS